MELASSGISVIAICPGYVSTDFQRHAIGSAPTGVAASNMFRITAPQCAEAIARAVERNARAVVTPWTARLFIAAAALFPNLVDSRLRRMQAEPSQP
jgi:short-subunit dehydrogenase